MELSEFAEQVLFATSLEDKLRYPAEITDDWPGLSVPCPSAPGRPPELRFKTTQARKADFPGIHQLEQTHERGRLLHFFANHELLATELMALVLLRFPEAPPAFRRGVLQTLRDEQEHTRLYIHRMEECGIRFGELPVSGYFWRAIAGMQSPLDYVTGLSLTFEQANLDFARHFGLSFSQVGDTITARLLDRIYHDEIGHVAYGLKWFRRWKNPGQSDWEAFCRQLKFPLSPQQAKGVVMNFEGRRAAGLDPAFIDELNIYSHSKGRTPVVFHFNPFAEGYLGQGRGFTPVKHQAALADDLENLPQFLCRQDDVVLVKRRPSVKFLSALKQAGFVLPEFVEIPPQRLEAVAALADRKLSGFRPWAWGPDSLELLQPLFRQVASSADQPGYHFHERTVPLYAKAWSAAFLRRVLAEHPHTPWLCTEREVGVEVGTPGDALAVIQAFRREGYSKLVAKENIGLAGHNAIRLWEPELLESQRRWITKAMEFGRKIVVEPWLERELDFSIQLEMAGNRLKLQGYTGLINDRKGQFQANWAAPNYARQIPGKIPALFRGPVDLPQRLRRLYAAVFSMLEWELLQVGYQGPLGIDAFVYRTPQGDCRLKPIVEINPRYSMGRLTLELMKRACPGSHGLFRLVSHGTAQAESSATLAEYARALQDRFPLRLEGAPLERIREGAVCLNNPDQAQVCLAIFRVSRNLESLVL